MGVSTQKLFSSAMRELGKFKCDYPQEEIKNEQMFFNSSADFAYRFGGEITRRFLDALPPEWRSGVFDSRVHMLMPGWYPGIPGWHHDDVPRPGGGQPDYDHPTYHSEHIMGLVNGEICPTAFALGMCVMPAVPPGETVYKVWNDEVDRLIATECLDRVEAESGTLIGFNWQTFHACQRANGTGWRWFGRISRNTDRCKNITNEVRRQVQAYLEFPTEGW